MQEKMQRYIRKNGGIKNAVKTFTEGIHRFGMSSMLSRVTGKASGMGTDYAYWIEHVETKYIPSEVAKEIATFTYQPLISVLIPVYNVEEKYLRACIDSIRNQYYTNWQLCIADDCSTEGHVAEILNEYMALDKRVEVVFREENGHISEATNSALEIAKGEFIALVDNDDMIKPEALFEVVKLLQKHPNADMIYSDEDKVDETGMQRIWPAFKPGWSPDGFFSQMYLCHLGVYRTELARKIGGFRTPFVGAQDYDFALRLTEHTRNIYHIPKILYHWRMIPTSTSMGSERKNYAFDASYEAKKEVLDRRGLEADIIAYESKNSTVFQFATPKDAKVTICIDIRQRNVEMLMETMRAIEKQTPRDLFKVLFLVDELPDDEQSDEDNLIVLKATMSDKEILEEVVAKTTTDYIFFTEAGVMPEDKNWFETMVGQAAQSYTGAVGARVLTQQGYIEQAGLIAMPQSQQFAYAFHGYHENDVENVDRLLFDFNYIAFSKKALMVEKRKVEEVIHKCRLDQKVSFDISLCICLYELGYFNVYKGQTKFVTMDNNNALFYENLASHKIFERFPIIQKGDPFYNKNFSEKFGDYTLKLDSESL